MSQQAWNTLVDAHIPSDVLEGRRLMEELLARLEGFDWVQEDLFGVHLAVEEALVNAIRHGNREDQSKRVRLLCKICDDRLRIEVADEGQGFDPAQVPDPTESENLEVPSGRGIMLMRNFMHYVEYNDVGNQVVMEKHRPINGHR
jgi:serine/threonine-protein kinase RsbW